MLAAFGCDAGADWDGACACWLSLVGLGVVPSVFAAGLLLRFRHGAGAGRKEALGRRRRPPQEADDALEAPLLPPDEAKGEVGNDDDDDGGAADGHRRDPISSSGVVKGSWPLLYLREALICCHVGYQGFALLTLLGVAGGDGGGSSHASAAGSFWWGHDLATRLLSILAWSTILLVEERLHEEQLPVVPTAAAADAADAAAAPAAATGAEQPGRRPPWALTAFYLLAFLAAAGTFLALLSAKGGFDAGDAELWDLLLVGGLLCPVALTAALARFREKVYPDHFTPEMNAAMVSHFFHSWMNPLFAAAHGANKAGRPMDPARDIFALPEEMQAEHASRRLLELRARHPTDSLWTSVFRLVWRDYTTQFIWRLLSSASVFVAPLALRLLVTEVGRYMAAKEAGGSPALSTTMWACVACLFLGPVLNAVGDTQAWVLGRKMGCLCRGAVASLVMRKALRLDVLSVGGVAPGELTNLLAVDAQSLLELMVFSHMITGGVEVLLISAGLLFNFVGLAAVAGLAVILVTAPLNSWLQRRMKRLQARIMARKDARMSRITEALYGIRVIKLFAWEPRFAAAVDALRELELGALRAYLAFMGAATVILRGSPTLVALVTFLFQVKVQRRPLDPAAAFAALALFNLLRFPLIAMPEALNHLAQARISLARVERFLRRKEAPGCRAIAAAGADGGGNSGVEIVPAAPAAPAAAAAAARIVGGSYSYSHAHLTSAATTTSGGGSCRSNREQLSLRAPLQRQRTRTTRRMRRRGLVAAEEGAEDAGAAAATSNGHSNGSGTLRTPLLVEPPADEGEEDGSGALSPLSSPPSPSSLCVLRGIDLVVPAGALTVVYGPTGGGKTSLLMALLGEIDTVEGGCALLASQPSPGEGKPRVAYVSQRPWILNATLRENILFGRPFEPDRYWAVVAACALEADLLQMPAGDATEIGEKGVNLSGGQQQRCNLARALYADAEMVVMDDVLSAVDAPVAEHLYREAIQGFLRGKTRVLVTHQTSLTLPGADHVVLLERGGVTYQGPPSEAPPLAHLHGSGSSSNFLAASVAGSTSPGNGAGGGYDAEEKQQQQQREGEKEETAAAAAAAARLSMRARLEAQGRAAEGTSKGRITQDEATVMAKAEEAAAAAAAAGKGKEGGGEGTVAATRRGLRAALAAYRGYFGACGPHILACLVVFTLGFSTLNVAQSLVLKDWLRAMEAHGNALGGPAVDGAMELFVFTCLGTLACLFLRAWIVEGGSLGASRKLHRRLLDRVLHAPMAWFDATPYGRIFNRFSTDFQTVDKEVMASVIRFGDMFLSLVGVAVVSIYAIPQMALAMAVVLPLAFYIANAFLGLSKHMKRFESAARSPVYAHFAEAVSGVIVIRAYGVEPDFLRRLHGDADEANRMHFYLWTANYYMSMRLRTVGATVAGVTALAVVLRAAAGGIDAATAGLALTYALPFSQAVVFSIRTHAELGLHMASVERVLEYLGVAQEAPAVIEGHRPPQGWPSRGEVTVERLVVRYRPDLDPVLKQLSFRVPPRTKVGVVGRTGSGKSTLMMALFRMVEPDAENGGGIVIDGLDTGKMGLADLRGRLAVIPQEPTLFKGTIRSNLDIFGHHADAELWDALRRVHLDHAVASLEQEVSEGGANLSVGERQLLCFARALLKRAAVVVMDEATASVDNVTDAAIQETIRTSLNDTTVLCIAHRLHTVMYYDRVLVLDHGRLLEYDSPLALLQRDGSRLRAMAERTGDLAGLVAIAEEAAAARRMGATEKQEI